MATVRFTYCLGDRLGLWIPNFSQKNIRSLLQQNLENYNHRQI